jgi:hypothetical protein
MVLTHLLHIGFAESWLSQLENWDFLLDSKHFEHAYLLWRLALFVEEALILLLESYAPIDFLWKILRYLTSTRLRAWPFKYFLYNRVILYISDLIGEIHPPRLSVRSAEAMLAPQVPNHLATHDCSALAAWKVGYLGSMMLTVLRRHLAV